MKKYKPILKQYKKFFNDAYKVVHNPNKTNHDNIQNTFIFMSEKLGRESQNDNNMVAHKASVGLKALIDDFNGTLTHYFISDKSLVDFLKNTEVKDTSIVDNYVRENSISIGNQYNASYYSIALHTEEEGFVFTYLINSEKTLVLVFTNENCIDFTLGKSKINESKECKLAVNLIYYLKAFPEKILDGVPQDMIRDDKKKFSESRTYNIGIADEIVEKTEVKDGRVIIPHFRSGFFRHYSDDRYINMKGKVQFIAATMVKGKAKTVVA